MELTDSEVNTAKLLNTSFFPSNLGSELSEYFNRIPKLGNYCILNLSLITDEKSDQAEKVKIIADREWKWFNQKLIEFLGKDQFKKLSVKSIQDFMTHLKTKELDGFQAHRLFRMKPLESLKPREGRNVYYLEDLTYTKTTRSLFLCILTQFLIEKYTQRESKIVLLNVSNGEEHQTQFGILLKSLKDSSFFLLDPTENITPLNKLVKFEKLTTRLRGVNNDELYISINKDDFSIEHPNFHWREDEKIFSIIGSTGNELCFEVLGRTSAEKRFKKEAQFIERASDDDLVPMEFGFHPYWRRLGHTTLRIGDALYELSSHGWKSHSKGADSPRAYIFNNPYFKEQFKKYCDGGMPPVSVATTVQVKKSKAVKLWIMLENLSAAQGREREKFSLYFNNCNQGIMRVLSESGFQGFESKGFIGFSSVLSFRKILLQSPLPVSGNYVYPLPGSTINESNLRNWIPNLIYRHNSVAREMLRALPSLAYDGIIFFVNKIGKMIYKFLGIKLIKNRVAYYLE